MAGYVIGKVIAVSGEQLIVSILPQTSEGETQSGVPDSMEVSVTATGGDGTPVSILIGQPGSFVGIQLPNGLLLCLVAGISMKEDTSTQSEVRQAQVDGEFVIDGSSRALICIPIGTIDQHGAFERGSDVLPTVNAQAYAVLPETIDSIYKRYAEGDFSIGKLSLLPSQEAKINLNAFLSRHAAILGQTGGGKSWTVASILQKIGSFPQSTTILLDTHGEYAQAFGDSADHISVDELEFPYWLMNSEELLGLMIDRSESAAPNQVAKFRELLQQAKEEHPENQSLGLPKITIDTPVFFDFRSILDAFDRLDTQMVPGKTSAPIKGPLHGQFTRLLMRIYSRLNDRRYDLIFNPKTYKTSASMEDLFRRILGRLHGNYKKTVILDLSAIPFDVRSSTISLIMRCLFDFAYWHRRKNGTLFPIAVFCDEAHVYLNDRDSTSQASRASAERIAKEGRKYGISLTVISQRPRELSSTILSQCGSFLCLRTTNPDDQSYIKNLLPDNIRGVVSIFQTLRRGECVLLGDAVMMPTRIHIDKPAPTPHSNDASFVGTWSKEPTEIDIASVLQAWRMQGLGDGGRHAAEALAPADLDGQGKAHGEFIAGRKKKSGM